ncbi:AraC family transcriptional regulator [Emticicia sp. 21SJ11W-3]|uniref:AraC family transcriptional regulator n=1 Tax=Emticicia sp. 21SJ11W-3 TaxID=2916755 RepID=UPI00209EC8A9|nr:AraC family transcriptional regulator [Emticicia sp. 21SJ11W-3]UTA68745.1 AraC family transcriptional regulator [Emticicia sp. 21SJ11W-3]
MELSESFLKTRRIETLVENRSTFTLNHTELSIFETHQMAENVYLKFSDPVLASMISGKKIMHLNQHMDFDFLPGESVILPSDEIMCIDFPEASLKNPTKCLAMAFDQERLDKVINNLNEIRPKIDNQEWKFTSNNFHFTNDIAIQQILQRLVFIFTEQHPSKDIFADLMIQELIIRIVQTETRVLYSKNAARLASDNRIAHVVNYIKENIREQIQVEQLCKLACMSESNFYRVFKEEMGISPIEFIIEERIKLASSLLKNPEFRIKDVYFESGFNSLSYFNRIFKKKYKVSPSEYKHQAATIG